MKRLGWQTITGRQLAEPAAARRIAFAVGVLSLLPVAAALVGVPRLTPAFRGGVDLLLLHALLDWTPAVLALVVAGIAAGQWSVDRQPEARLLALIMPFAALLEGLHATAGWGLAADATELGAAKLATWTVAGFFLALALVVCGSLVQERRRTAKPAIAALLLGATAAITSFGLQRGEDLPALVRADSFLHRPWELPALVLFAVAGLLVLPALVRTGLLGYTLLLGTVPFLLAQLELAIGSTAILDPGSIAAHSLKLIGYGVPLLGLVLDRDAGRAGSRSRLAESATVEWDLSRAMHGFDVDDIAAVESLPYSDTSLRILNKAIETMTLGVTITNAAGRILYVNPADARMHGYRVSELLGQPASLYGADSGEPPLAPPSEVPWVRERLNDTKDGHRFPVRLISCDVQGKDGRAVARITVCEDLGDRKKIEEGIERRDKILEALGLTAERFLVDTSTEGVDEVLARLGEATEVDLVTLSSLGDESGDGQEVRGQWASPRWLQNNPPSTGWRAAVQQQVFSGWHAQLLEGRPLVGNVDDLDPNERDVLASPRIRAYAVMPIFVGGDLRGLLALESLERDRRWPPAEIEALRTAARTIGAARLRRENEIALAASEDRYRSLLEGANDLIQAIGRDGRFLFVNRAWRETLGYSAEETRRLSLWDILLPRQREETRAAVEELFDERGERRIEVEFIARSGARIAVEGNLTCISGQDRGLSVLGIFRDLTERRQVDRMKQEFISTVSHEIRTPLTSIIASLSLLKSGRLKETPGRAEELIVVAHRNSRRLLQLINDLLDLQKLTTGHMKIQTDTVPLAKALEDARTEISVFASSRDIELELAPVPNEAAVAADPDRLGQVLANLLSNAIKFSPESGTVRIGADADGDRWVIRVEDQGPGIPPAFRSQIFDRFSQVDSSHTRSSGGSGLGLSIAKGLTDAMDGTISFSSEVGEGTTFYVSLAKA